MIHTTPSRTASSAWTSCRLSTTGKRRGRFARTTSSSHPGSRANTSLYRKRMAAGRTGTGYFSEPKPLILRSRVRKTQPVPVSAAGPAV